MNPWLVVGICCGVAYVVGTIVILIREFWWRGL